MWTHDQVDFIDNLQLYPSYFPFPLHLNISRKETTVVFNLKKRIFPLSKFSQRLDMVFINTLKKNKNYHKLFDSSSLTPNITNWLLNFNTFHTQNIYSLYWFPHIVFDSNSENLIFQSAWFHFTSLAQNIYSYFIVFTHCF